MKHKGWIALDIDGTITANSDSIPKEVIKYLESLENMGWKILFITGRTFAYGYKVLKAFSIPYYFAMQHGADILEMPAKKPVSRSYMSSDVIKLIEEAYKGKKEDFLIYSGYEKGDFCYFRKERFSKKILNYIEIIQKLSSEPWHALNSFDFDKEEEFPLIKCVGCKEEMLELEKALSKHAHLHITTIKDPIIKEDELYLCLVTDAKANKGSALNRILSLSTDKGVVIAAGNDANDISMLKEADIAIAISTGPDELIECADIIARPAKENGIIQALEQATKC